MEAMKANVFHGQDDIRLKKGLVRTRPQSGV
jgi:hypothetical protein